MDFTVKETEKNALFGVSLNVCYIWHLYSNCEDLTQQQQLMTFAVFHNWESTNKSPRARGSSLMIPKLKMVDTFIQHLLATKS